MSDRIAALRRFNRFYTRVIGLLDDGLQGGAYSLTEIRVLFEIRHRDGCSAAVLARELGLDTGYLSRILSRFDRDGLLVRVADPLDGRRSILRLSVDGDGVQGGQDVEWRAKAAALLDRMAAPAADRVLAAMAEIERTLGTPPAWELRGVVPGDLGWIISRHGSLYAAEYGWDGTFEHAVAEIVTDVMRAFDPAREAAWIAVRDGVPLGSVFLVRQSDTVAKLRLLIVDPAARGLGIGARLVSECTAFARAAGYQRITLWTHSILTAARRLYAAEGYVLTASGPIQAFGVDLTEETWELALD